MNNYKKLKGELAGPARLSKGRPALIYLNSRHLAIFRLEGGSSHPQASAQDDPVGNGTLSRLSHGPIHNSKEGRVSYLNGWVGETHQGKPGGKPNAFQGVIGHGTKKGQVIWQ